MTKTPLTVRQGEVLELLRHAGPFGLTYREVGERAGWGTATHGRASGALSGLHRGGHAARLEERRGGMSVYVAAEHVGDRRTLEYNADKDAKASRGDAALRQTVVDLRAALAESERRRAEAAEDAAALRAQAVQAALSAPEPFALNSQERDLVDRLVAYSRAPRGDMLQMTLSSLRVLLGAVERAGKHS